jgi:hypothetical protein
MSTYALYSYMEISLLTLLKVTSVMVLRTLYSVYLRTYAFKYYARKICGGVTLVIVRNARDSAQ